MIKLEQLNIVGKRSGEGFVAHKAMLVRALSMAIASRVILMDITLGLKGLLGYFKALGGSNVVKVIPSNGSASGKQATDKRLKVICGANTSTLEDGLWIGDKTPLTLCEVRVSPKNSVKPNIGANELAEALARVLPFTATDDNRPVLQSVLFVAKDGKLTLVSADGFRLAVVSLDYEDGEGQALINRDDLKGIASSLKLAKRARISFEGEDVSKPSSLTLDTELIRYKWTSSGGNYPDWQKLIPTDCPITAHFDTVEATKAVSSLKALADSKGYPIDLAIGDGQIVMANPDDRGQVTVPADTNGGVFIRVDGSYLAEALRACGGMVDFNLSSPSSPMLFSADGYQLVVMPMLTDKAQKAEAKAKAKKTTEPELTEQTEPVAEPKAQPSKAKQPAKAK